MSVRDLQATLLHLLGFEAQHLTYSYQGLDNRLIGPAGEGVVRQAILA